jgi:hypothetical protein
MDLHSPHHLPRGWLGNDESRVNPPVPPSPIHLLLNIEVINIGRELA